MKPGDKITRSVWRPDEHATIIVMNDKNIIALKDESMCEFFRHYAESDWMLFEGEIK